MRPEIVSELPVIIDNKFEERKSELATKQDLNDLRVDVINKLNDHFK